MSPIDRLTTSGSGILNPESSEVSISAILHPFRAGNRRLHVPPVERFRSKSGQ